MPSTSATGPASLPSPPWHAAFLAMLPAIERHAQHALRQSPPHDREEALQAVVAYAAFAYARLVQLDKAQLGYAAPLARYGVQQYRVGRMVGGSVNSHDVGSVSCRRRGCTVEPLDDWKDVLAENRSTTPADIAALRIDFGAWFETLSPRDRRLAKALASGEQTSEVARMFRLTAGRVSQLRRELHVSWQRFLGEAATGVA